MSRPHRDRRPSRPFVSPVTFEARGPTGREMTPTNPLVATTHALHTVAEQVLAAELHRHTGRIGLRATPGGFGTPWFEAEGVRQRVRVEGTELVVEQDTDHRRAPLTTVR